MLIKERLNFQLENLIALLFPKFHQYQIAKLPINNLSPLKSNTHIAQNLSSNVCIRITILSTTSVNTRDAKAILNIETMEQFKV